MRLNVLISFLVRENVYAKYIVARNFITLLRDSDDVFSGVRWESIWQKN